MAGSTVVQVTDDAPNGGVAAALLGAVQHLILQMSNRTNSSAAIAIATTKSKVQAVTTSTSYTVDGAQLALAATDNFWTLTGATLTAGQVNKYLLLCDASGTASCIAGTPSTTAAGVTFAPVVSGGHAYPSPGPSLCILGQVQVTCNSSTFVPGTTLLDAATITVVYRNGFEALATGASYPAEYGL